MSSKDQIIQIELT
jgi:hypothetical protein